MLFFILPFKLDKYERTNERIYIYIYMHIRVFCVKKMKKKILFSFLFLCVVILASVVVVAFIECYATFIKIQKKLK